MEDQELIYKKELESIRSKKYRDLINRIEKEASSPLCASYEYDATPTGEERLKRILQMILDFKVGRSYVERNHLGYH